MISRDKFFFYNLNFIRVAGLPGVVAPQSIFERSQTDKRRARFGFDEMRGICFDKSVNAAAVDLKKSRRLLRRQHRFAAHWTKSFRRAVRSADDEPAMHFDENFDAAFDFHLGLFKIEVALFTATLTNINRRGRKSPDKPRKFF